ncbi:putative glycolipid-binding domain-containing protein [Haematomicrobium sanguinis]|uniref:putative glycolipid-binding domain-containing protein n=1 Tax=Haematomicrobium sanguinis TaxID=479106 RepID=UPI00068F736C|nr:putative glycolipid-binding domain-containing protein [Haematomicrobium sanguinis]
MDLADAYMWRGVDDPSRQDSAWIHFDDSWMQAHGFSLTPEYELSWDLRVDPGWITRRLRVSVVSRYFPEHGITDPDALSDALDCDLALCPVTNTMPIRRLGLLEHPTPETTLTMAWVEVPSLRVVPSRQIYSSSGDGTVRYQSAERDFTAELTVDADGVVIDYPGLAKRISS